MSISTLSRNRFYVQLIPCLARGGGHIADLFEDDDGSNDVALPHVVEGGVDLIKPHSLRH